MKPFHPSRRKGWPYPMNYYPPFWSNKDRPRTVEHGTNALRFAEHGVDFRILLLGMLRRGEMWKILPCFLLLAGCTQPRHDWMEHVAQNTSIKPVRWQEAVTTGLVK